MHRYAYRPSIRDKERNEGNTLMPKEVVEAVEAIIACGKEVIVRKEKGKWVVLESGRRLVYKEP